MAIDAKKLSAFASVPPRPVVLPKRGQKAVEPEELEEHLSEEADLEAEPEEGEELIDLDELEEDEEQEEHEKLEEMILLVADELSAGKVDQKLMDLMEDHGDSEQNPAWVKDATLWEKVKKAVDPEGSGKAKYDYPLGALIHTYKRLGGGIQKK